MAQFVERRRREYVDRVRDAEAAARGLYRRTIRPGESLKVSSPSQVATYGRNRLQGATPQAAPGPSPKPPQRRGAQLAAAGRSQPAGRTPPTRRNDQLVSWLDGNPTAKVVGGGLAQRFGNTVGLASGAFSSAKELGEGAVFVSRLVDPKDWLKGPAGGSAASQLIGASKGVFDYASQGITDPQKVVRDVRNRAHQLRVELDPTATPIASTFSGELRRNFDIGQNQGEAAIAVGTVALGGPAAKAVGKLGKVSKVGRPGDLVAKGLSPEAAAYLSEPYFGLGHHYVAKRHKWVPAVLSESKFNVLRPNGISRGDFYELHYRVDPRFHGARLPKRFGGESWSGKRVGLEKYDQLGRIWHGSPTPLKIGVGGVAAGGGGLALDYFDQEERR